jgi:hypothetical protein
MQSFDLFVTQATRHPSIIHWPRAGPLPSQRLTYLYSTLYSFMALFLERAKGPPDSSLRRLAYHHRHL